MDLSLLSRSDLESLLLSQAKQLVWQANQIVMQAKQIVLQAERISNLEAKVNCLLKDSRTSSKPPSSDMFNNISDKEKRGGLKSQRKKSVFKPGGQIGHKGVTRRQFNNPDRVECCYPRDCGLCGKSLQGLDGELVSKRQEIDIPSIVPIVSEYRQYKVICSSCGYENNKGSYPDNINSPMQIGQKMRSLLVYLNVNQLIPYDRLSKLCEDLLNFSLCKRTIENSLEKACQKALPLYGDIMKMLKLLPGLVRMKLARKYWERSFGNGYGRMIRLIIM